MSVMSHCRRFCGGEFRPLEMRQRTWGSFACRHFLDGGLWDVASMCGAEVKQRTRSSAGSPIHSHAGDHGACAWLCVANIVRPARCPTSTPHAGTGRAFQLSLSDPIAPNARSIRRGRARVGACRQANTEDRSLLPLVLFTRRAYDPLRRSCGASLPSPCIRTLRSRIRRALNLFVLTKNGLDACPPRASPIGVGESLRRMSAQARQFCRQAGLRDTLCQTV